MARDFYDDSYEEYDDDYECDSYEDGGYEWTEEDSLTECLVKCQRLHGSMMR
jgi:hypothetical protein